MGSEVIVVDHIFEEFVGKVIEVVEGCSVADVAVQGTPKTLDLLSLTRLTMTSLDGIIR